MEFQTQFQNLTKKLPISVTYRLYMIDIGSLLVYYIVLQHNYSIKCRNHIALSCALARKFRKEYFIIATQIKFKHFNLVRSTQFNAKLYRYYSQLFYSKSDMLFYLYIILNHFKDNFSCRRFWVANRKEPICVLSNQR